MIFSSFKSSSLIVSAIALATATFISGVIEGTLASNAPLKIPGKAKTLLI